MIKITYYKQLVNISGIDENYSNLFDATKYIFKNPVNMYFDFIRVG